jgi:hypothetical protein
VRATTPADAPSPRIWDGGDGRPTPPHPLTVELRWLLFASMTIPPLVKSWLRALIRRFKVAGLGQKVFGRYKGGAIRDGVLLSVEKLPGSHPAAAR